MQCIRKIIIETVLENGVTDISIEGMDDFSVNELRQVNAMMAGVTDYYEKTAIGLGLDEALKEEKQNVE